jgi:hypothetical protein
MKFSEGSEVAYFMLFEPLTSPLGPSLLPRAILLVPLVLALAALFAPDRRWIRPLGFLVTVFLAQLTLLAASGIATGPHHLLLVAPYLHLFVGIALGTLWTTLGRRRLAWLGRGAVAAALVALLAANLALGQTFHQRLAATGGAGGWSSALYELHDVLRTDYPGRTVELLDWGFDQSLILLSRDTLRLRSPFWRITAPNTTDDWIRNLLLEPDRVFIQAGRFSDHQVRARLQAVIDATPGLVVHERRFLQPTGQHAFSILTFTQQP